jgi:UDP-N-acetylmuramoyl-L-alanyl-D-glutamate--2,6-diaminopimelate ligase
VIRKIKNLKHLLVAVLAVLAYRNPARDLYVIGVTGTDGKTTTAELIAHLLAEAGHKVAKISTLGAKINNQPIKIGLHVTTPNPLKIQKIMRMAVNQGVKFFVLESTSHGLDQHRLLGCNFRVAVITNLTREHLDYHGSWEKYLQAKAKLFRNARYAVLNKDDASYQPLLKVIKEEMTSILTYGFKKGAYLTPQSFSFSNRLVGRHNRYNSLAAVAVAKIFEVPDKTIRRALLSFQPLSGRLEEIKAGQSFKVFVDFAHTPGAFKEVLAAVRKLTKGRIIHVFGCTGDRDKDKRPVMGKVAADLGDLIILTHEDTYKEKPQKIIKMIEPGVKDGGKELGKTYWKVDDRRQAVAKAVSLAKKNDTVLLTGVGHQTTLNLGGQEVPWSDQKEVIKAIRKATKKK